MTKTYGTISDTNLKLIIALSRVHSELNRRTQSTLNEFGLTLAQFGVLEALYHLGDMKICEIIAKTLSTSGNMTVVINNLERDGYVTRYISEQDKRVSVVSLTEKGQSLIAEVFPVHVQEVDAFFSRVAPEDKQQLLELLKQFKPD